jgi:hypothetical protein
MVYYVQFFPVGSDMTKTQQHIEEEEMPLKLIGMHLFLSFKLTLKFTQRCVCYILQNMFSLLIVNKHCQNL